MEQIAGYTLIFILKAIFGVGAPVFLLYFLVLGVLDTILYRARKKIEA